MFNDLTRWVAVLGFSLVGLAGLFYAAHGESVQNYHIGLGTFVVAVAAISIVVRRALDDADASS